MPCTESGSRGAPSPYNTNVPLVRQWAILAFNSLHCTVEHKSILPAASRRSIILGIEKFTADLMCDTAYSFDPRQSIKIVSLSSERSLASNHSFDIRSHSHSESVGILLSKCSLVYTSFLKTSLLACCTIARKTWKLKLLCTGALFVLLLNLNSIVKYLLYTKESHLNKHYTELTSTTSELGKASSGRAQGRRTAATQRTNEIYYLNEQLHPCRDGGRRRRRRIMRVDEIVKTNEWTF